MLYSSKIILQDEHWRLDRHNKESFIIIQGVSAHAPNIMLECQLYIDPSSEKSDYVQAFSGLYYIFDHVL